MSNMTKRMVAAAVLLAAVGSGSGASADPITFSYTASVQTFIVPTTGIYEIDVAGAQGGTESARSGSASGGLGAIISGDVSLTAGTVLEIVVGGEPGASSFGAGGGGGGGSFVYILNASSPPIVAGGRRRAGNRDNGGSGQTGTNGQTSIDGSSGGTGGSGGGGGGNVGGNGTGNNGAGGRRLVR